MVHLHDGKQHRLKDWTTLSVMNTMIGLDSISYGPGAHHMRVQVDVEYAERRYELAAHCYPGPLRSSTT